MLCSISIEPVTMWYRANHELSGLFSRIHVSSTVDRSISKLVHICSFAGAGSVTTAAMCRDEAFNRHCAVSVIMLLGRISPVYDRGTGRDR